MISIIVPYYERSEKDKACLDRLKMSIKDQDYTDYELIVQVDETGEGASITRNKGAAKAKGDILFFIDHDCMLQPGMLRECADQLADNPDIDFVYGNYRFFGETVGDFHAQPFDAYLLETFNYISTMSPIRTKAFNDIGGFKELPYFQDWDLFYRASKAGSVGKWINEFLFWTEKPDEGSISGDTTPLDEKCHNFREWNGITHKDLVVTTLGAPLQAIQRAKLLNADYVGPGLGGTRREIYPSQLQFKNWKATYLVGCFNEHINALEAHLSICVGKPIIHFIGTDAWHLYNAHPMSALKEIKAKFEELGVKVFANAPRLVEELKDCHIDAELLYTPIYDIDRFYCDPLPEDFTVAVMISDTNPMHMPQSDRSHVDLVYEVANAMPTVKFKFFGSSRLGTDTSYPNIEYVGKIDKIEDFIQETSMLLRATIHDGYPQSPVQWLLSGRDVLITCPDEMKGAHHLGFEEYFVKPGYTAAKQEIIDQIYNIRDSLFAVETRSLSDHFKRLMSVDLFVETVRENI